MPLSRKEYNEMIAYITKPRTKTISEDKKSYSEEMRIGTDEMIDEEQYKNFIPVMPDMPGMEDPKLRQVELAEGGLPRVSKNALADDALKGLQTMKKKGIKNVSKYASQIAKSPLSKFIAAETGLGALLGAPKSGPQPQGLNINYNTVKTVRLEKINGRYRQSTTKR
jgi:hypothetical protein